MEAYEQAEKLHRLPMRGHLGATHNPWVERK